MSNTNTRTQGEEWRPVPFEELGKRYEISNHGEIRIIVRGRNKKAKLKAIRPNNVGYLKVNLYIRKKQYTYSVHRLVALTFLPNPFNYQHINHKDLNKRNNRVDNLEWISPKANSNHYFSQRIVDKSNHSTTQRNVKVVCKGNVFQLHYLNNALIKRFRASEALQSFCQKKNLNLITPIEKANTLLS